MDRFCVLNHCKLCDDNGVKLVLDTTKDLLTKCLHIIHLHDINQTIMSKEIFGVTIETEEQIADYAKTPRNEGTQCVDFSRW